MPASQCPTVSLCLTGHPHRSHQLRGPLCCWRAPTQPWWPPGTLKHMTKLNLSFFPSLQTCFSCLHSPRFILQAPCSRTLTPLNSSFSFTNPIRSASPVGSMSETSPPNTPVPGPGLFLSPLGSCNRHLTCLHACTASFVRHRLSHIISPGKT